MISKEAKSWASSVTRRPSRSCETCAWIESHGKAGRFLKDVLILRKEEGASFTWSLLREKMKRDGYPLSAAALRAHFLRCVVGGQ